MENAPLVKMLTNLNESIEIIQQLIKNIEERLDALEARQKTNYHRSIGN